MKPTLYLMLGYPGAGKTTAAKVVHDLTGAVHLSSDHLRLEMFPNPTFSEAEHAQLYEELDERTEQLLKSGQSVIYDANLNRYEHRADKYAICERTGAESKLFWVQTPRPVAKERAVHESRSVFVPQHETPDSMFDRIAEIIEEPRNDESYIAIDGTKINQEYIRKIIGQS